MCSLLHQSNALFFFVSKAFEYLVCLRMILGEYLFYFYSDGILKAIRPRRKSGVKLENGICPCFLRFLKKYRRNDVSLMQNFVKKTKQVLKHTSPVWESGSSEHRLEELLIKLPVVDLMKLLLLG